VGVDPFFFVLKVYIRRSRCERLSDGVAFHPVVSARSA